MKEMSRTEAREKIEEFFNNIKSKNKEEIKKMKNLASHNHIRLGEKRRLFCKHCFSTKLKVRKIAKEQITKECLGCGKRMRWRI